MFKSKLLPKTKIYDHGLFPLLMKTHYSKFILAIKTLIFDGFSKKLQVLLRQIELQMLNRKYFTCFPAVKNYHQKFIIRGQFYTLGRVLIFGQIGPLTLVLSALEHLKNTPPPLTCNGENSVSTLSCFQSDPFDTCW